MAGKVSSFVESRGNCVQRNMSEVQSGAQNRYFFVVFIVNSTVEIF